METMKAVKPDQIVQLLQKKKGDGTAKELARQLGVTEQYLSDVLKGRRTPGPAIIAGLGLEMVYRPIQ